MDELIKAIKKARFVFVCGNGGSAATAEHFTNDLFSKGVKAFCLNSNVSLITMIANDFGYQYIFSRQLDLYAGKDDLLIVISGSGNSENILEALIPISGFKTFALLGMGGGKAIEMADDSILIDSDNYGIIEDKHMEIVHRAKDLL